MEVIYFLIIAFIVNFTMYAVDTYGKCSKGGFHQWYAHNYKTGFVRDSGYRFGYSYCVDYRCRKCGKIDKWDSRK